MLFGTYLGGSNDDHGYGIAVDAAHTIYITGCTRSPNFPVVNALYSSPPSNGGANYCADGFVTKLVALPPPPPNTTPTPTFDHDRGAADEHPACGYTDRNTDGHGGSIPAARPPGHGHDRAIGRTDRDGDGPANDNANGERSCLDHQSHWHGWHVYWRLGQTRVITLIVPITP